MTLSKLLRNWFEFCNQGQSELNFIQIIWFEMIFFSCVRQEKKMNGFMIIIFLSFQSILSNGVEEGRRRRRRRGRRRRVRPPMFSDVENKENKTRRRKRRKRRR